MQPEGTRGKEEMGKAAPHSKPVIDRHDHIASKRTRSY